MRGGDFVPRSPGEKPCSRALSWALSTGSWNGEAGARYSKLHLQLSSPGCCVRHTTHLTTSISYLEVAGKITVPHRVRAHPRHCTHSASFPETLAQHWLVLELDQGCA